MPFVEYQARNLGSPSTTFNIATRTLDSSSPGYTDLFQSPSPRPTGSGDGKKDLSKMILEWLFAVTALLLIAASCFWRYSRLRRNNRTLAGFLGRGAAQAGGNTSSATSSTTSHPSNSISAGERRTRGADIDADGRRIGRPDADAVDGGGDVWDDDKDLLPAYDNYNGPPKYRTDGEVIQMIILAEEAERRQPPAETIAPTSPSTEAARSPLDPASVPLPASPVADIPHEPPAYPPEAHVRNHSD